MAEFSKYYKLFREHYSLPKFPVFNLGVYDYRDFIHECYSRSTENKQTFAAWKYVTTNASILVHLQFIDKQCLEKTLLVLNMPCKSISQGNKLLTLKVYCKVNMYSFMPVICIWYSFPFSSLSSIRQCVEFNIIST